MSGSCERAMLSLCVAVEECLRRAWRKEEREAPYSC